MAPKQKNQFNIEISRENLHERVWATPINHLADRLGVTATYLTKLCEAQNVPRPPPGYWQKKAVGKSGPRPELPTAVPDGQTGLSIKAPPSPVRRRNSTKRVDTITPRLKAGRHAMLRGAEEHFLKSRKIESEEFLRPYKLLLPDIVASETSLISALTLANKVYTALDIRGHRVSFAPSDQKMRRVVIEERESLKQDRRYGRYSLGRIWSPQRPTITVIDSVPIGLALTEMTERVTMRYLHGTYVREDSKPARLASSRDLTHSWTTEQDVPCGRFRLIAFSPIDGVNWVQSWQDTKIDSIEQSIEIIVQKLEDSTGELQVLMRAALEEAAKRHKEWEEARERYRREDDQRLVAQAEQESQKQLSEIMDKWASAMSVQRFFSEAERRIEGLHGEQRAQLMQRLALAKALCDGTDPLEHLAKWLSPDERYRSSYPSSERTD
jgi:hypothetical protein